jgi:hypothetical protein
MVQLFGSSDLGQDCGVFVLYTLVEWSTALLEQDRDPKYPNQVDMYSFRHDIAESILQEFE